MELSWQQCETIHLDPTIQNLEQPQSNQLAIQLVDEPGDQQCDSMQTFLQLNLLSEPEKPRDILFDQTFKEVWYKSTAAQQDFAILPINHRFYLRRFDFKNMPSVIVDNASTFVFFANQDNQKIYLPTVPQELQPMQKRIEAIKSEQLAVMQHVGKRGFCKNAIACFVPFLNVPDDVKINVLFCAFQHALWHLSTQEDNVHWVVITSPAQIPNVCPFIAWHAILLALRDFIDRYPTIFQSKFFYLLQPINKFDELVLKLLMQIYFPRVEVEKKFAQFSKQISIPDFLTGTAIKATQSVELKNIAAMLRETEPFQPGPSLIKQKATATLQYQLEQQLKAANLDYVDGLNVVVPLTTQFQTEQAWGILAFNFRNQQFTDQLLKDVCLWMVRNTGLNQGVEHQFYLVWFVGCYEARQLMYSLMEKLPDIWTKRIRPIIVRPFSNFKSWVQIIKPRFADEPVVCDNITMLKDKFPFIRTNNDIDKWDSSMD